MRNVKLVLEYDGTNYSGWQVQANAITVQERLEAALKVITGEQIRVIGASRTDAGVHARGQTCNFRTTSRIPINRFPFALNANLPGDIVVVAAESAPLDFHARFDAQGKLYRYRIMNRPLPSALWRDFAWHVPERLDLEAMQQAAVHLEGEHDFAAFQAAGSAVTRTVRQLHRLSLSRTADGLLVIEAEGNGFLYHMVRIIVGTLVLVGRRRLDADAVKGILESRDRTNAGPTAPAHGLMLETIYYPQTKAFLDTEERLR
ncbi:MAG: tRNA pseudouridine(38-40) synthase TruA [Bacillota bacterium]